MKIIETWCPRCITRIFLAICYSISRFLGLNKKKDSDGLRMVQEEEQPVSANRLNTATTLNSAFRSIDDRTPISPETQQKKVQTKTNNDNLFGAIQKQILFPEHKEDLDKTNNSNNSTKDSSTMNQDLLDFNSKVSPQGVVPKPVYLDTSSFRLELKGPELTFQQQLAAKTKNLQQLFNLEGTQIQIQTDSTTNSAGLQIRCVQSQKLNIFIYSFFLPCSYEYYSGLLNDYELQKSFDTNIDEYRLEESLGKNLRINYLAYKKVLIVSPRDFVYLKYSVKCGVTDYYDIAFSVHNRELNANKIRGEIILNASKVVEEKRGSKVYVYSEVDMKLAVNPRISRNQGVTQIKKYVNKCVKYVKDNYKP